MHIKLLVNTIIGSNLVQAGKVVSVDDNKAKELIEANFALPEKSEVVTATPSDVDTSQKKVKPTAKKNTKTE